MNPDMDDTPVSEVEAMTGLLSVDISTVSTSVLSSWLVNTLKKRGCKATVLMRMPSNRKDSAEYAAFIAKCESLEESDRNVIELIASILRRITDYAKDKPDYNRMLADTFHYYFHSDVTKD